MFSLGTNLDKEIFTEVTCKKIDGVVFQRTTIPAESP